VHCSGCHGKHNCLRTRDIFSPQSGIWLPRPAADDDDDDDDDDDGDDGRGDVIR